NTDTETGWIRRSFDESSRKAHSHHFKLLGRRLPFEENDQQCDGKLAASTGKVLEAILASQETVHEVLRIPACHLKDHFWWCVATHGNQPKFAILEAVGVFLWE